MGALQNALFMRFEGALGPNPTPSRVQAIQVLGIRFYQSLVLHLHCLMMDNDVLSDSPLIC